MYVKAPYHIHTKPSIIAKGILRFSLIQFLFGKEFKNEAQIVFRSLPQSSRYDRKGNNKEKMNKR